MREPVTVPEDLDEEFAAVAAELGGLTGAIREQSPGRHLSAGRLSAHESEIDKLHGELERIANNDFLQLHAVQPPSLLTSDLKRSFEWPRVLKQQDHHRPKQLAASSTLQSIKAGVG